MDTPMLMALLMGTATDRLWIQVVCEEKQKQETKHVVGTFE